MFSIILPVYNEKENIGILVPLIFENLHFTQFEVIIIDDNSNDGTEGISNELCKKFDNLIYFNRRNKLRSLGLSAWEGIEMSKHENIILMDCDLSHSIDDLVRLINLKIEKNYDLICCSRFINQSKKIFSLRYNLSNIYSYILKPFLSSKVLDNLSGFFLLKKSHLNNLDHNLIFYGYGDYYFRLLYYLQKNKNLKIFEMNFFWKDRQHGKSKTKFLNIFLKYTLEAIKLRVRELFR